MTDVAVAESGSVTTVPAPEGAHFEDVVLTTKLNNQPLGTVPILVWDDITLASEFYGAEGLADIVNGTALGTTFKGMAKRLLAAGKDADEIARAQVAHRPGKRQVAGTPTSRVRNAAERAAEMLGDNADRLTRLLDRIATGEISPDVLD